ATFKQRRGIVARILRPHAGDQAPTVVAGAAIGAVSAVLAGSVGVLGSPNVAAAAGSVTMIGLAAVEAAFASRIAGHVKHATFQAANLATWAAWATGSALFGQPELGSLAVVAS